MVVVPLPLVVDKLLMMLVMGLLLGLDSGRLALDPDHEGPNLKLDL